MSPFFSGIWFFAIGTEPEAAPDHFEEQHPTTEEQGKRSPIISDPMFSKYFNSRNIACGSNESFIDR